MRVKATSGKYKNAAKKRKATPKASKRTWVMAVLMTCVCALPFFWRQSVAVACIAFPILFLAWLAMLLTQEKPETLSTGAGVLAVLGPSLAMLLWARQASVQDGGVQLLLYSLVGGALLFIPMALIERRVSDTVADKLWGRLLAVGFFAIMLSFSWINSTNIVFDTSKPTRDTIRVTRVSKSSSSKGSNRYYAHGENTEGEKFKVNIGKDDYQTIKENDELIIYLYEGFWKSPYCTWSYPTTEQTQP